MKKIFISYSSKETEKATEICDFLESNGYSCFIANRNLIPGKEYAAQLIENMDMSGALVLLLSVSSNASPHVLREIEYAVSHNIPIIVYKLEEVELSKSMEYFLMTHQWINENNDKKSVLLNGIRKIMDRENASNVIASSTGKTSSEESIDPGFNPTRTPLLIGIAVLLLIIVVLLGLILFKIFAKDNASSSEAVNSDSTASIDEVVDYKPGDTVTFGTYYDCPIEWRVIRINNDGSLVLLSKDILTMKSFDAPEAGEYNSYEGVDYWSYENHIVTDEALVIKIRGNNDWSISNLRTWLNSDKEVVNYPDYPPTKKAVGDNFYYSEPGFLYNFTEEEKSVLLPVSNKTIANTFSENASSGMVTSVDYVYLLSSEELAWIDEAGISPYAAPTPACEAHDNYHQYYESFVEIYQIKNYYWWLRDNPGDEINKVYIATTEYEGDKKTDIANCGTSDYGVRPVVTVDATGLYNLSK